VPPTILIDCLIRSLWAIPISAHHEISSHTKNMMKELNRHGYDVGAHTLYPVLHDMKRRGYLVDEKRIERDRMRIYYGTTNRGRAALRNTKGRIGELVSEVMKGGILT